MSWNIKTPGDYINGPLTVAGDALFLSKLGVGAAATAAKLQSNGAICVSGAIGSLSTNPQANTFAADILSNQVRLMALGPNNSTAGSFSFVVASANANVYLTAANFDSSGRFIRGGATADTLTTDGATMVNIGNFAVQNAANTGTFIAIKPDVANQNVNINVDARSGGIPDLRFLFGSVEKFRMTATGNINFQSGQGINFGATTEAAGMTSELLNDYEEGTWTIGLTFGGLSTGITASANQGKYVKVGRKVTVTGYLSLSNKGSATGDAVITGLPFQIGNSTENFSAASLWLNVISFADYPTAYGAINNTTVNLQQITNAGVKTNIQNTAFANNSELLLSFTYFV